MTIPTAFPFEAPARALVEAPEEAVPAGAAEVPAPDLPAAVAEAALAAVPTDARPADIAHAALPAPSRKRGRGEDDGDVGASDPPEIKRRQPAQRGIQLKAGFKFSALKLWS
ncbi:hypothetical protein GGF50DRAFT_121634 [Schizophyllum commune]